MRYIVTILMITLSRFLSAELLPCSHRRISKFSHNEFFKNRNWKIVSDFWEAVLKDDSKSPPAFIVGDSVYSVTDLQEIKRVGEKGEFISKDNRYKYRKTYAMRIGYNGLYYQGFQKQNDNSIQTVERDLKQVLKGAIFSAGRTDKGVSAISQVINFVSTSDESDENEFLQILRTCSAAKAGEHDFYLNHLTNFVLNFRYRKTSGV
jgi:hypothetical protein